MKLEQDYQINVNQYENEIKMRLKFEQKMNYLQAGHKEQQMRLQNALEERDDFEQKFVKM